MINAEPPASSPSAYCCCGAGPLAAALRDRAAQIAGFDSSPAMVTLAQRRLGTDAKVVYPEEDYFVTSPYTGDYTFNGQTVFLTFWHRPLHATTDAFTRAGFKISVISEPPFSPETPRELLPPGLGDRTAFLCVLFFVLETV
jgi:hypothetical protein